MTEPAFNLKATDVIVMNAGDLYHCAIIDRVIDRIKNFCGKYPSDMDPDALGKEVLRDFYLGEFRFLICVALINDEIVGHLLAAMTLPPWGTRSRVHVLQHELNEDFSLPADFSNFVLERLEDWGRKNNSEAITAIVFNDALARRLKAFYGFKDDLRQLKRVITKGESDGRRQLGE